jgi:hypothetical protein
MTAAVPVAARSDPTNGSGTELPGWLASVAVGREQHDAHIIAPGLPGAGNLPVFGNQSEGHYPPAALAVTGGSRVLGIDPVSRKIVWQYTAEHTGRPELVPPAGGKLTAGPWTLTAWRCVPKSDPSANGRGRRF